MDEPTSDVPAPDITPDDFMADEQESTKVAPSTTKEAPKVEKQPVPEKQPVEAKASVVEKAEEPKEEVKADDTAAEPQAPEAKDTETEAPKGDETETTVPTTKADERKNQLNTEIRDLVSQRNALKEQVTKANAEVYQPATENELVDQGLSATDAKVEALRQEIAMRDYNERVADAQLTLSSESNRVLQDFPLFNADSDSYNKELAEEAAATLDANLIRDENSGQIIGVNPGFSTYQFYQTLARASGISQVQGQIQGQQAVEQQLANADTPTSSAPAKKPVDPLMELWMQDD